MFGYIFTAFVVFVFLGMGYQAIVAPRRWMRMYGDGNYNPLRRTYKNAGGK